MRPRSARTLLRHARQTFRLTVCSLLWALQSCSISPVGNQSVDILIVNGQVYDGSLRLPKSVSIGIVGERIVYVGELTRSEFAAARTIDASGLIVAPGFIDPHTHSLDDLSAVETSHNLNYLTQGVTTVLVGNDGGGTVDIGTKSSKLDQQGIGTNVGFLAGHGHVRRTVMGEANRPPTELEQREMLSLMRHAMQRGALGMSSGLYYTPGSFADTTELIDLASVVAEFDGIYDTHIRDESSYTIGLIAAVREAIEIGRRSGAAVNISHIKALGVDVWGQSRAVVNLIESAREDGVQVTADQYPWKASGTSIKGALIPKDHPGMSDAVYPDVLNTFVEDDAFVANVCENLRRRGGPDSILITAAEKESIVGLSLTELAAQMGVTPIDAVLATERAGGARIASFNMSSDDVEAFMSRPWVMTSSDGSTGHPRKYATFPMKYQDFVVSKNLLTLGTFIHRSSTLAAETFNIRDRGRLDVGKYADIVIFDPQQFLPIATFANPTRLSTGVDFLLVNGTVVISNGEYTDVLAGQTLSRDDCRLTASCHRQGVSK